MGQVSEGFKASTRAASEIGAKEQERKFREDAINLKQTKDILDMSRMIQDAVIGCIPSYTRKKKPIDKEAVCTR